VTLFFFIVFASWLDVIPSGHPQKALPSQTGDLNLTIALAIAAIVAVHATAIRVRGWRSYLRHFLRPSPWVLPINIIEELAKPFTLALRLFGNVFAGSVMVLIILELIPTFIAPVPLAAWVLFSMAVAVLQGFLFSLLTIVYFQAALDPSEVEAVAEHVHPTHVEPLAVQDEVKAAIIEGAPAHADR
ncbi:MAG: FoF1 ATP synthase subunit A, partial [Acidimicrobiales bacterium]